MPKLAVTLDSLDSVDEPLRSLYVERGGKYVLDADIEDPAPLKEQNAKLFKEAKAAKEARRELEAQMKALQEEQEAKAKGLTAETLAEIRAQAEAKFQPVLAENDALKREKRALLLDSAAKSLLAKAGAVDVEDAWKVVGSEFDLTEDGAIILKGDPTVNVEQYITKDLVAKKAHLFKGTQAAGGGAAGVQRGAGIPAQKPVTQWTSDERRAFIEANGAEAHSQLLVDYQREQLKPKAA